MSENNALTPRSREPRLPARSEPVSQAYRPAYDYTADQFEDQEQGSLIEYWRMLQRRKGTVILIAFVGALVGLLVTLPQTPVYQARLSLEVQDLNQNFMNMKEVSPVTEAGGGSLSALTDIQTQIKILQSESLIEGAIAKLKTANQPEKRNDPSRISAWRAALDLQESKEPENPEDRVKRFASNLKVRTAGQTRIIELLFDSIDAQLAAEFSNALANEFIDQNIEARWKMTQRTGVWLERQLEEMRIKLERSEDALQVYARRSGLLFTGDTKGE
ncbi:MAG: hypothetical protein HY822_22440, partial [Acidobacteria bacterium]|nr:hypothetical protein [Acidobacteriota bacterium]